MLFPALLSLFFFFSLPKKTPGDFQGKTEDTRLAQGGRQLSYAQPSLVATAGLAADGPALEGDHEEDVGHEHADEAHGDRVHEHGVELVVDHAADRVAGLYYRILLVLGKKNENFLKKNGRRGDIFAHLRSP